jgi:hypothetical protein
VAVLQTWFPILRCQEDRHFRPIRHPISGRGYSQDVAVLQTWCPIWRCQEDRHFGPIGHPIILQTWLFSRRGFLFGAAKRTGHFGPIGHPISRRGCSPDVAVLQTWCPIWRCQEGRHFRPIGHPKFSRRGCSPDVTRIPQLRLAKNRGSQNWVLRMIFEAQLKTYASHDK